MGSGKTRPQMLRMWVSLFLELILNYVDRTVHTPDILRYE